MGKRGAHFRQKAHHTHSTATENVRKNTLELWAGPDLRGTCVEGNPNGVLGSI